MNSPQPRITDLLKEKSPLLSVEFFPPKSEANVDNLIETARKITALKPDFTSVTYGAGGSTRSRSASVSKRMKDELDLRVMPHLTCVNATRDQLGEIVDEFYDEGYRNIMALRGDPQQGQEVFTVTEGGFGYASDLIAYIQNRHPEICLGIAGYPEKHPQAPSLNSDIEFLKVKADAGGSFITTQLFFDNAAYFSYVDRVRAAGIDLPIIPGIMPVLSVAQIKRIAKLCDASLPTELETQLDKVQGDVDAVKQVGINWAQKQMSELIEQGVAGIHLYALNKADAAIELMSTFRSSHP